MNRTQRLRQAGFTLIEALVVLSILALIAVLTMTAFDGAKSKAQTLITVMGQSAQASQQFRTDTGVYPAVLAGLTDRAQAADLAGRATNAAVQGQWARPYMGMQKMNGANFVVDKVGAGVELSIGRAAGGLGHIYFIEATNVPEDVVTNALRECNSSDGTDIPTSVANMLIHKCVGTRAAPGTFRLVFDQTR